MKKFTLGIARKIKKLHQNEKHCRLKNEIETAVKKLHGNTYKCYIAYYYSIMSILHKKFKRFLRQNLQIKKQNCKSAINTHQTIQNVHF